VTVLEQRIQAGCDSSAKKVARKVHKKRIRGECRTGGTA
jgi:hypothetical protein